MMLFRQVMLPHILIAAIFLLVSCGNDNPTKTWSKVFGGEGLDLAVDAVESPDGGYLFAGSTNSFTNNGNFDIMVSRAGFEPATR